MSWAVGGWGGPWHGSRTDEEKPAIGTCRAGLGRRESAILLGDAISPVALRVFEGFDLVAGLFQRAGDHATNCMAFVIERAGQLVQRRPVLALKHRDYLGLLAALARRAGFDSQLSSWSGNGD